MRSPASALKERAHEAKKIFDPVSIPTFSTESATSDTPTLGYQTWNKKSPWVRWVSSDIARQITLYVPAGSGLSATRNCVP